MFLLSNVIIKSNRHKLKRFISNLLLNKDGKDLFVYIAYKTYGIGTKII